MIRVKAPSVGHVVQDVTARQAIPGDRAKKKYHCGGTASSRGVIQGVYLMAFPGERCCALGADTAAAL